MARVTIERIRNKVDSINNYVLKDSDVKIKVERVAGGTNLYLVNKKDKSIIRTLAYGSLNDLDYYTNGINDANWYFSDAIAKKKLKEVV